MKVKEDETKVEEHARLGAGSVTLNKWMKRDCTCTPGTVEFQDHPARLCPYKQEMFDDCSTCNCCSFCRRQCADDI